MYQYHNHISYFSIKLTYIRIYGIKFYHLIVYFRITHLCVISSEDSTSTHHLLAALVLHPSTHRHHVFFTFSIHGSSLRRCGDVLWGHFCMVWQVDLIQTVHLYVTSRYCMFFAVLGASQGEV